MLSAMFCRVFIVEFLSYFPCEFFYFIKGRMGVNRKRELRTISCLRYLPPKFKVVYEVREIGNVNPVTRLDSYHEVDFVFRFQSFTSFPRAWVAL